MNRSLRCLLFLDKCKNMRQMKQVHAQIVMKGIGDESFPVSRIMEFCCKQEIGSSSYAELVFRKIKSPNLCLRNTMMKSFLVSGECVKLIQVYSRILVDGLCPDNYSLPYMLKACAGMQQFSIGEMVHVHVVKLGFSYDEFVSNTLIFMYMACGDSGSARQVFDEIPVRTAVSCNVMISGHSKIGEVEEAREIFDKAPVKDRGLWGSMLSGYVQNNCFKECLSMFRLMQSAGVEPDEGALVSVLCACAQLGAMELGTWVHHYVHREGFPLSVQLSTALVDMYIKCGNFSVAEKLFEQMPRRDVISWNVMILGLAAHGHGDKAFCLFRLMEKEGFQPDDTSFLALLAACSHSGMVDEGLAIFHGMMAAYNIQPRSEHYCCVVNILGRAGRFEEAKEIIESMPSSSKPSEKAIAWRTLLSACRNNPKTNLAEKAADHLLPLEVHSGGYILLSNIYESSGKYEEGRKVRKSMSDRGVSKVPGCSSIEIDGHVHEFVAG